MAHLWTPIFLPYGSLANWYDSTDTTTLTLSTGDTVAQWRDKSYDANDLSETDFADLPVYGTTNLNGLSTVDFDEAASINLDDSNSTPLDTSSDHYIIYAGFNNTHITASTLFSFTNATNDALLLRTTTPTVTQFLLKDGTEFKLSLSLISSPNDNRAVVYAIDSIGNEVSVTLNYNNTVNGTKSSGDPDPLTTLTLGAADSGGGESNGLNGQIGELVLAVQDSMTTADKQKLEGYMAWKWGLVSDLPGGHPYKSAAPTVTDIEFRDKLYETSTEEGTERFRRLFAIGYVG